MSDDSKRGLTPILTTAFALWIAMTVARLVFFLVSKEPWSATRFNLVNEGTGFAAEVLAMVGSFELARRHTGNVARGITVAAWGFAGVIAFDVAYGLFNLMERPWEHTTLMKVSDYGFYVAWLTTIVGLAIAHGRERRGLAIALVAVSLVTWPPAFIAKDLYSWMPDGTAGYAIEVSLRLVRMLFMLGAFSLLGKAAGAAADPALAASGLRTSAKSMWLRLVAAIAVPLLTLIVVGSRGRAGLDLLKLATVAALVINVIAFVQFAIGALRTSRASLPDLGRWPFVIAGAASLWAAGVMLSQLSWLYKLLYRHDGYSGQSVADYAQALSIALPVVVIGSIALVAVAISGFAARRGNQELRGHAQSHGAGFVMLSLVAMGITSWMTARTGQLGGVPLLVLLALAAGLAAIVMVAKLLGIAADELEKQPGLPTASIVSDGT